MSGKNVLSLIQTPKNVGNAHNQFMFYTKGSNPMGNPCCKVLNREDGNWTELIGEVRDWLNRYIPPHMLISVSLFEDAHENVGKGINACITHCAGKEPEDITENAATDGKTIYDIHVIAGTGEWEGYFNEAKGKINATGGAEGHMVASTNDSSNDGAIVLVISWSSLIECNLREAIRPAGCCTIF